MIPAAPGGDPTWRRRTAGLTGRLRGLRGATPTAPGPAGEWSDTTGVTSHEGGDGADGADRSYAAWVARYDSPDASYRRDLEGRVALLAAAPAISVIMPVFDTPEPLLRAALDSVLAQWYPHWELCAVDDGSTAPHVAPLLAAYASLDHRITVRRHDQNRHIAAASNTAVAATTHPFIAPLDHDDVLAPHALAVAALALAAHPDAGMLYSDEDHLDGDGRRCDPYFKPDFDPVLLLGQNYFAHLCLLRRDLVESAGGYRLGFEGSQDWDLVLRVVEQLAPDQVVHVPQVLYHWRAHRDSTAASSMAKPYAVGAGRRAVAEHLARTGRRARVQSTPPTGFNRVRCDVPDPVPPIEIIVVARTGSPLRRAVDSVLQRTTYPDFAVTVVTGGPPGAEAAAYLGERAGVVGVLEHPLAPPSTGGGPGQGPGGAPPLGALLGAGAAASSAEVLCFLHDDVEVLSDRWLEELLGVLLLPGVGAAGATLLAPGGAVRHAGYRLGPDGSILDATRGLDRLDTGYFGQAGLARCVTAASSAALLVRRSVYQAVGGHWPGEPPDARAADDRAADVEFGRRLGVAGWRCAVTPHAELVHHECDAVAAGPPARATGWAGEDPSSNPNLALDGRSPAWPPRPSRR